jgi:Ran GTPase-activating protein (RanGAP) involved in mRNA processing and transport
MADLRAPAADEEVKGQRFALSGPREMLTKERAEALVAPLRAIADDVVSIKLSGFSFGVDAANVFAPVVRQLKKLKYVDYSDIIGA